MANTLINPLYPRPHIKTGASSVAAGIMLNVGTSSATSFTASNFDSNCMLVVFDIQTANVVVTLDNSTPAAGTSGHILISGTNYTWQTASLLNAKFIAATGTSAQIYASQWAI